MRIVNDSRLLRDPLYTFVYNQEIYKLPILSFNHLPLTSLPQNLFNEMAYYKNAARLDRIEMFEAAPKLMTPPSSIHSISSIKTGHERHIFLVVPTLKIDDVSKHILLLAEYSANIGWGVSIVCTDAVWKEDVSKTLTDSNEMLPAAYAVTSDVFDLPLLGTYSQWSRLFQKILLSRSPDFILIARSNWAVLRISMIRNVLPNSVVAYLETSLKENLFQDVFQNFDVLFSIHNQNSNDEIETRNIL